MAKHSGKSSTGNGQRVVLGRRGGRFHDGFQQRDEAAGDHRPAGQGSTHGSTQGKGPGAQAARGHSSGAAVPQRGGGSGGGDRGGTSDRGAANRAGERGGGRGQFGKGRREEPRRQDSGYRNREDARVERDAVQPAMPAEGTLGRVLAQLAQMPQGATAYQLAQEVGEESRVIGVLIRRLVAQGKILEVKPGRYQISGTGGEHAAMLELEEIPGQPSILRARLPEGEVKTVNPRYTIGAKAGDVVQVAIGEDDLALVTRILRRLGREVVGTIQFKPDGAWLVCDNRREGLLKVVDAFPAFEDEYRVGNRYVGIIQMDSNDDAGVRVDRVLGKETPEIADFQYVCLAHDLPGEFPPEVVAQANAYPKKFPVGTGKAKREDLREKLIFTIDPATAKDFDDAISLEHDDQGRWVLGVHIADVSHYVVEDTPLDAEASARGTSCYLVNRVIPMLPEVLSNGLCSLVPHEPRYCLSAFLTIDRSGKLVNTRLAESVIDSKHRFTYEEAMDVLVDRDPQGKWPAEVRESVKEVGTIAQTLRRNRERAGALNLFSVEHRFRLDVNGIPLEIIDEVSDASHQLIEECMLLANRAVAEWLEQKGLPCVYRLHQEPDEERLAQFASVLEVYGKDSSQIFNRFGLQKMLGELAKEPPAARKVLNYLCLRAFKKAVYGTEKLGHYALAFASYAHFTSPIRRYPDLLVHRLVKRGLGLLKYKQVEIRPGYLDALAKQSSFLEQRAAQAERDLDARKSARYLAARIGESFPAVVVSAFPGGLSIQLLETGMDGMLPMRELRDDFYSFDAKRLCLVGKRSARTIGCGAELDVIVNSVDIDRADIVFGLEPRGNFAQAIRAPKALAKPAAPAPELSQVIDEPAASPPASLKPATNRLAKGTGAIDRSRLPAPKGQSSVTRASTTHTPTHTATHAPASHAPATPVAAKPVAILKTAPPLPEFVPAVTPRAKPATAKITAAKTLTGKGKGKAKATVVDEADHGLEVEPETRPQPGKKAAPKKVLPIDKNVDRRRVPERWRIGHSDKEEAPRAAATKPSAKPAPGSKSRKSPKGKTKHRW